MINKHFGQHGIVFGIMCLFAILRENGYSHETFTGSQCMYALDNDCCISRAGARRGQGPLGGAQHPYWEFPAPVLREADSTPTQHPLWAKTMITQIHGTDRYGSHAWLCGSRNSYSVKAFKFTYYWRKALLLTTEGPRHNDTLAFALTWQSYHVKDIYYERFQLIIFWPFFTAQRVCIAQTMLSIFLSIRLLHAGIVSKRLNISNFFITW